MKMTGDKTHVKVINAVSNILKLIIFLVDNTVFKAVIINKDK